MQNFFNKKKILITGASSGIGKALSQELAKMGAKLFLLARRGDQLQSLQTSLVDCPGSVAFAPFDLQNISDITSQVSQAVQKLGGLDILINNAGVGQYGSLQKSLLAQRQAMMDVNFLAASQVTQAALADLEQSASPQLVFINSIASFHGSPHLGTYAASKAALHTLCQSLRAELAHSPLKILEVFPGVINNSFHRHSYAPSDHPYRKKRLQGASQDKLVQKILQAMVKGKKDLVYPTYWKIYRLLSRLFPSLITYGAQKKMAPALRSYEKHA